MTKEVYSSNTAISMADFDRSRSELDDASTARSISFTKFTDTDKKTAKCFDVVDDKVEKSTCGSFWHGEYQTITLPYDQLPDYIKSMSGGEFIVQGVNQTLTSGKCPDDATRSKELFPFSRSAGVMCIDTDSINKFKGINNLEDLHHTFHRIEPNLKPAFKFSSSSASSYVEYKGVNSGLKGVHTFIPIDNASYIPRVLECLHVRCVNAGYGYALITKDGKILIRSLVDMALKTSNQPIFEGGAIIKNPAITQHRSFNAYLGYMLKSASIPALSEAEWVTFSATVKALTEAVAEEAAEVKKHYILDKTQEMQQCLTNMKSKNVAYLVESAINGDLYGQTVILLDTGEEVTVQTILDNPTNYHGKGCADPINNSIFGKSIIYTDKEQAVIHSFAKGGGVFKLKETLPEWNIELNLHVEQFNKAHTQTLIGGKHKVMRKVPPSVHHENRESYEFISINDLKLIHGNQMIQVGEKKKDGEPILQDVVTAWSKHPACVCYTGGVVFAPARKLPPEYYNTWRGYTVEPIAGADTSLVYYHIDKIICDGNKELQEYLYNWIAFTFQYPDKPAGASPVLCGEKGVGKGIFGHYLGSFWGDHGIHMSQSRHLVGNFNSHLADVCFVFADEAFFSGDKKTEGVLKALITEPTVVIERKGLDAVEHPNCLKIVMATNNEHAVPASKDERRYCVLNVSNARRGDAQYFKDLTKVCNDNAVKSAFLYDMLNRDISGFSPSAIPESDGLKEQRLHSLGSVGKWLVDSFSAGSFGFNLISDSLHWEKSLSSKDLYDSYIRWINTNKVGSYEIVTQQRLGKYLGNLFTQKKLSCNVRGYYLGSLNEAIKSFQNYEKVDLGLIEPTPFTDWFFDQYDESVAVPPSMIGSANSSFMGASLG